MVGSIRRIRISVVLGMLALLGAFFASSAQAAFSDQANGKDEPTDNVIPGQYIVVLKDSVNGPAVVAQNQVEQRDGKLGFVYRHAIKGYSAKLSKSAVAALRKDPRVKYVSPVRELTIQAQTTPTGIKRIFANENKSLDIDENDDVRVNADVAVIDTGIDYEHPDLDVVDRTNCVPKNETPATMECIDETGEDDHGHGTHVAGTIGAIDNGTGVVGAAPGARLWAVKVLNEQGAGYTPWILAGIDWVTAHAEQIEVANMSLGGYGQLPEMDEAISASVEAGVVYVVAAGNQGEDAELYHPANSPDVITVSALADTDGKPGSEGPGECYDSIPKLTRKVTDDELAWFSNRGPAVELAAPGVCVLSTYPDGEYGTLSGTSMASPHVAGAAAVLASESNPSDKEDVEAIRQALIKGGSHNWSDPFDDPDPDPLLYLGPTPPPLTAQTAGVTETDVATHTATLRGVVNPGGLATTYRFDYGTTSEYGQSVPVSPASAGAGTENVNVSTPVSNVQGSVTYHYRIVATNSKGTVYGKDRTFTLARWERQQTPKPEIVADFYDVSCASPSECVAVGSNHFIGFGGNFAQIERWDGSEWSIEPIERPTEPEPGQNSKLTAVSCTSASFCMAVGNDFSTGAFAERWDGSEWSLISLPSTSQLYDVTCLSSERCIAVGGNTATIIEEWDGSKWKIVSSPNPSETREILKGVSCLSTSFCVAVGASFSTSSSSPSSYSAKTLIETWSGSSWSIQTSPNLPEVGNRLVDVSCTSSSACLAVGGTYYELEMDVLPSEAMERRSGPLAARWDGTKWSLATPGRPLSGISCIAADSCVAVGEGDSFVFQSFEPWDIWDDLLGGSPKPQAVSEHWNGKQWVGLAPLSEFEEKSARGDVSLEDVSCMPEACMGVGMGVGSPWGNYHEPLAVRLTPVEPIVLTGGATDIAADRATLNATVNPERLDTSTTYQFEYGKTAGYGSKSPASPIAVGSGFTNTAASTLIEGLTPNQTYHFRVVVTSAAGTTYGQDMEFTSSSAGPPTFAFSSAFGTSGSGNGQFNTPNGIAIDSQGDVWVAEGGNNRVQKFNSKGEYLSKFGTAGSGNGQFNVASGIAIDPEGNLWVTDTFNNRVQKFNSKGEYLSKFGSAGSGNGQFSLPNAIAIDSQGNLWVVDPGNNRVQKFNSKGEYLSKFGTAGSGNGQFNVPSGIAIDSQGDVWVADFGNNRVQQFSASGTFLSKFGEKGSGNGQFNGPGYLAFHPSGTILVPDFENHRVQQFTAEGKYINQFGTSGAGNGQFSKPKAIAFDGAGDAWVVDQGNKRVQEWVLQDDSPDATTKAASAITHKGADLNATVNPKGLATTYQFEYGKTTGYGTKVPVSPKSLGWGTSPVEVKEAITGLEPKTTYHFRIVATSVAGTTYGQDLEFTSSTLTFTFSSAFGTSGSGNGQFNAPNGIAIDSQENVYVVDRTNSRVQKFNSKGEYLSKFGSAGSGNGQFSLPNAIAIDSQGNLWVVDSGNSRVQKFNSKGEYLSKFGSAGSGNGQFSLPNAIAIDSQGNLWVVDTLNSRVQKFNSKGEYLSKFGSAGSGNGQLSGPIGIAIDSQGDVWVTEVGNNRVQQFSASGTYLSKFGTAGSGNGQFNVPGYLAFHPSGTILVPDFENHRVQRFTETGEYINQFGTSGTGNGQFSKPRAIAIDGGGDAWVVDQGNNRVQKWVD